MVVSNDAWLRDKFSDREWFDSVGHDEYKRLTVYVKYMNLDVLTEIPLQLEGSHVLVAFATSKRVVAEDFKRQPVTTAPLPQEELPDLFSADEDDKVIESTDELCAELDRLEKICGSNCLQDIFYEIHDGPNNSVTNLSARYPEVKDRMSTLYDEYGFDLIYEELDG